MSPIHLVVRTLLPLCLGGCIVLPPPRQPAPPAPKPAPLPTAPFPTATPGDSAERPPAFVINRPAPQPPTPIPVPATTKAAAPSKSQPATPPTLPTPPALKPTVPQTQTLALITDTTLDIPAAEPSPSPIVKELTPPEPLALRTRSITTVAALSDAEALGPIVEREPPPYDHALMQRLVIERAIRPAAPPVRCKAERSRDRQGEKITISCANTSKEAQTVFLQIKAIGMTGLPPPDAEKSGYALKPGANQRLVTLVADSRSPRAEIHFTHQPRK